MRHVATICFHQVRRIVFDTGTVAWLIGVPLALIGVLGSSLQFFMSSGFVPVEPYRIVIAEDGGDVAAAVAQSLHDMSQYFGVVTAETRDAARAMVARREADAAIVFSATNAPTLSVISAPDAIVTEMLMPIVREVSLHVQAGRAKTVSAVYTDVGVPETSPGGLPDWLQTDAFSYYTAGVMAMFVMFAAHSVGSNAARERATDAYARIRAFGVKPAEYMVGSAAAGIIVSMLFIAVLALVANVLFDASWGGVVPWSVLTVFAAVAAAGLSLVITALFPRPDQTAGIGTTVYNFMAFLGGSMVPLHTLPVWVRDSLEWLPTRAVLSGYLKVSQGADLSSISSELTTLGAAGVACFALGWIAWNRPEKGEAR